MLSLISKLPLLLMGIFLLHTNIFEYASLMAILSIITFIALNIYFSRKWFTWMSTAFYLAICLFFPSFMVFISIILFQLIEIKAYKLLPVLLIPLIASFSVFSTFDFILFLFTVLFAGFLSLLCIRIDILVLENQQNRDESITLQRTLQEKNTSLLDSYNNDIYLATLKERNRIAREIHDNVGHLLSRSILQMGAVQAMNQDEHLKETLVALQETLGSAMDSVRGSVHNLRDDAMDLQEVIYKMLEPLHYEISFAYELTEEIPNPVKYCFLGVLKEALTNLTKHSNATEVQIVLREHPALYQLLIHDNGNNKPNAKSGGMGLTNMEERVNALNGQFHVSWQKGFRIFISIPKENNK